MSAQSGHTDVSIVGFGARTPVGATAVAAAAAVRAAVAMFGDHPYMIDKAGNAMVVAIDPFLPPDLAGVDRLLDIARPAASEALAPLSTVRTRSKVEILVGLPEPRPGLPVHVIRDFPAHLKDNLEQHVRINAITAIDAGHSSGLMALQEACRRIKSGSEAFYLVGGVDSYHEPETLEWLDANDQLHSETNTWGMIPGEAAGFCLVASQQTAERAGLRIVGKVLAAATHQETNLIKTDAVCLGEGLSRAVREALVVLPRDVKVDFTICDLNAEPYRADEFGYTTVRTSDHFVDASAFMTPADCWGDVGAASGCLFVMLAVVAHLKGYAMGPTNLIWTSSERGHRSAAIIKTGEARKES